MAKIAKVALNSTARRTGGASGSDGKGILHIERRFPLTMAMLRTDLGPSCTKPFRGAVPLYPPLLNCALPPLNSRLDSSLIKPEVYIGESDSLGSEHWYPFPPVLLYVKRRC